MKENILKKSQERLSELYEDIESVLSSVRLDNRLDIGRFYHIYNAISISTKEMKTYSQTVDNLIKDTVDQMSDFLRIKNIYKTLAYTHFIYNQSRRESVIFDVKEAFVDGPSFNIGTYHTMGGYLIEKGRCDGLSINNVWLYESETPQIKIALEFESSGFSKMAVEILFPFAKGYDKTDHICIFPSETRTISVCGKYINGRYICIVGDVIGYNPETMTCVHKMKDTRFLPEETHILGFNEEMISLVSTPTINDTQYVIMTPRLNVPISLVPVYGQTDSDLTEIVYD